MSFRRSQVGGKKHKASPDRVAGRWDQIRRCCLETAWDTHRSLKSFLVDALVACSTSDETSVLDDLDFELPL